tara:strand:- start:4608 stop:5021 length:414 start_codon:yes stop_codon:yes gene_type:complete
MMELPDGFTILDYGKKGVTVHNKDNTVSVSIDENKNYYRNREAAILILTDLTTPIGFGEEGFMIISGAIRKTKLSRWEFFDNTTLRLERGLSITKLAITAKYVAAVQLGRLEVLLEREYKDNFIAIRKKRLALEELI